MKIVYRELSEQEKGTLLDFFITVSDAFSDIINNYPDVSKAVREIVGNANVLFGVGAATFQFLKSRQDYLAYYKSFEEKGRSLIPMEVSEKDTHLIIQTVIHYLKNVRHEKKSLSYYYLNKDKAAEFVETLYAFCTSTAHPNVSETALRAILSNLTSILLQNTECTMLLTETPCIVKDLLIWSKQTGKDINELKKDVFALQKTFQMQKTDFELCIDHVTLPDSIPCNNILGFCNSSIRFCSRNEELDILKTWVSTSGISVCAITGPGGCGKSRLALHFAHLEQANQKVVWADKTLLIKLLNCNDFCYPQPVLFICDYAAQFEDQLKQLLKLMTCRNNPNVKFLLLERSKDWYSNFVKQNPMINSLFIEQPIDLSKSVFSEADYDQILCDFSDAQYSGAVIPEEMQKKIIEKAKEISGEHNSIRCLFLLLIADAFLRGESIQKMNAETLFNSYIQHSSEINTNHYGKDLTDCGYRILAYATACNSIHWEDAHRAIQKDLDQVMESFPDDRDSIERFFAQLSEAEEPDTVSALKPDLIGEYLFLVVWKKLLKKSRSIWLSVLLEQKYSQTFLARCLADWKEQAKEIYDMISDTAADAGTRGFYAFILGIAVIEAHSEQDRKQFSEQIKALNTDYSLGILYIYTYVIRTIFNRASKEEIRKECLDRINEIEWNQYCFSSESDDNCRMIIEAVNNAICIYEDMCDYEDALKYGLMALDVSENVFGKRHYITSALYNNIAGIYYHTGYMEDALLFYENALLAYDEDNEEELLEIASIYNNIGFICKEMEKYEDALNYYRDALNIRRQILGNDHLVTALSYHNLADLYHTTGKDSKTVKEYYQKALAITIKELGADHPNTALTYNNLAEVYYEFGDKDTALAYHQKALGIRKKILGEQHTLTASSYSNLASYYFREKNYPEALRLFETALQILLKIDEPLETAKTYSNIAAVYTKEKKYQEAIDYAHKAEQILEKLMVPYHSDTIAIYSFLADLYHETNDLERSKLYENKVIIANSFNSN